MVTCCSGHAQVATQVLGDATVALYLEEANPIVAPAHVLAAIPTTNCQSTPSLLLYKV